jgi:DNA polymerase III epsilon subunit-like protein
MVERSNKDVQAPRDFYISVDIETAGPNPSQYSLLTIGACTLTEPRENIYLELIPVNDRMTNEAFAVHHLDLKRLADKGLTPARAMASFEDWIKSVTPPESQPVFLAFNAPFDWMFVNDYFHRYLGRNPFGHTAVDIKALYMGATGTPWSETTLSYMAPRYLSRGEITHHALRDALDQAEMFEKILDEVRRRK